MGHGTQICDIAEWQIYLGDLLNSAILFLGCVYKHVIYLMKWHLAM